MEEQQQKNPIDNMSDTSISSSQQSKQTTVIETNSDCESSNTLKKQKKIEESQVSYHQDLSFNEKTVDYRSFSNKKPSESTTNPVQQLLKQAVAHISDPDSDEDEEKKRIAAAKKLLFPSAVATSFSEVSDTLRNERRQEFCPIYKDETTEEVSLRQSKQKPVGSLLAKRIRWDDLKRKRDEEEKKASQIPIRYGPYGPVYANPYEQYNRKMQNQPQQSFANPYEQYYTAMQNQYEQMVQMARAQQEHNGFWPEYQQQQQQSLTSNSIQQQNQPYTYPYPAMYSTDMTQVNTNTPSSYTSTDYNIMLNNLMQQPPPPPPNEPYPY